MGSILTVTNSSGTITAEQNFDAWGRKRNPNTWTYSNIPTTPTWLYRGYTMHEHLPEFGLINMNGRMYDPLVGRMLSTDNFIHDNAGLGGYNRYTYAFNNPLKYTDPDGEFAHLVVGALVGGFINGILHPQNFWKGFAIGAAGGLVIAATGGAAASILQTGSTAGAFKAAITGVAIKGFGLGAGAGAIGAAVGDPIIGLGNKWAFGDPYTFKQYISSVAISAFVGGVFGEVAKRSASRSAASVIDDIDDSATRTQTGWGSGGSPGGNVRKTPLDGFDISGAIDDIRFGAIQDPVTIISRKITTLPRSALQPTHYITKSKSKMKELFELIKANGIEEPIAYVEHKGTNYIVDGHHRYYAAQKLGIQNIPVKQVQLPYLGYKTPAYLMMEPGKHPGYWKYFK